MPAIREMSRQPWLRRLWLLALTGLALAEPLVSCEADAADWEECLPEEDTLLLQVGVRVFPVNSSEILLPGNVSLFTQQTLRRSVLESGVKFGPKTSAALFLLLSCTFGFACLCGNAKPFITAPYSEFPEEEESEEVRQQSLLACYFVVFMDAFGFGVYAPFVPVLAKTFSLQAHDIGMALAAFSLAQALNTPILGYLSDRFGRRPVLLVALAAESLAYLILSVAESFTCLMVGYIFAGAFCATIGVCNAYIAQVSAEEDRPVRLAYSSGSIALGLMTGPVLGAALSQQGFAAAVRICAALSMLNWTFVFSYMAESPNVLLRRQPKIDVGCVPDSLPRLAWPLLIGAFLGNAGSGGRVLWGPVRHGFVLQIHQVSGRGGDQVLCLEHVHLRRCGDSHHELRFPVPDASPQTEGHGGSRYWPSDLWLHWSSGSSHQVVVPGCAAGGGHR